MELREFHRMTAATMMITLLHSISVFLSNQKRFRVSAERVFDSKDWVPVGNEWSSLGCPLFSCRNRITPVSMVTIWPMVQDNLPSFEITSPRVTRDLFMFPPSFNLSPVAPEVAARSLHTIHSSMIGELICLFLCLQLFFLSLVILF